MMTGFQREPGVSIGVTNDDSTQLARSGSALARDLATARRGPAPEDHANPRLPAAGAHRSRSLSTDDCHGRDRSRHHGHRRRRHTGDAAPAGRNGHWPGRRVDRTGAPTDVARRLQPAWQGEAARDERHRPSAVGHQGQGPGRAVARAAWRSDSGLLRMLPDELPDRRLQWPGRGCQGRHGSRLPLLPHLYFAPG